MGTFFCRRGDRGLWTFNGNGTRFGVFGGRLGSSALPQLAVGNVLDWETAKAETKVSKSSMHHDRPCSVCGLEGGRLGHFCGLMPMRAVGSISIGVAFEREKRKR